VYAYAYWVCAGTIIGTIGSSNTMRLKSTTAIADRVTDDVGKVAKGERWIQEWSNSWYMNQDL
jgi:hypothetical protein